MMNNHNFQRRNNVILAAAIAGAAALSFVRPAAAQYPAAGADGHAQDANNRVGSGGYNGARGGGSGVNANDIIDRNVTGGRAFSGPIGERDPRAFSGPIPSGIDAFNKQSNAPTNLMPINNGQPMSYYGDNRAVAPPTGSLPLGFNGGYVGTQMNTPSSLSSSYNTDPAATTLQARTLDQETYLMNQALRSPDYTNVVDRFNQTGNLNFSPAYGTQTLSAGNGAFSPLSIPDVSPDAISTARMREELMQSMNPNFNLNANPNAGIPQNNPQQPNNPNGQQPANGQKPAGLAQPLNQPLAQPFDAPVNGAVSSQVTGPQLSGVQVSQTGTIPENAAKQAVFPSPAQQSSLLDTLQKRLAATNDVGKALYGNREATANAAKPAVIKNEVKAPKPEEAPVPVSSLATGIKAKGLHDVLASAEDQIREGKYDTAIQQYNQAFRVAPNNPLPILGRAHAELAGGYYARAEMDLRLVFRNDPELLLAQFDLKSLFPKDRIEYIRKDLHALANSDPKAERPWFLLAYLDYNSGDAASADKDLLEAEQRSGHADWSIRLLRQHWVLPGSGKTETPVPGNNTPTNETPANPTPLNK